jgi:hypothetical protein
MKYDDNTVIPDPAGANASLGHATSAGDQSHQTPLRGRSEQQSVSGPKSQVVRGGGTKRNLDDSPKERLFYAPNRSSNERVTAGNLEYLGRVIGAIKRQFVLITALSFCISVLTLALTLALRPQYTATTLLAVDPRDASATVGPDTGASAPSVSVDSEVEMMRSTKLAQQVVRRLDLVQNSLFRRQNLQKQSSMLLGHLIPQRIIH